jgi:hypothetical protein
MDRLCPTAEGGSQLITQMFIFNASMERTPMESLC